MQDNDTWTTFLEELPKGRKDSYMFFLDLLGDDLSDSTQSRSSDAHEFWTLLTDESQELLSFLVGVQTKDLQEYLMSLWSNADESAQELSDTFDYVEALDIDTLLDDEIEDSDI